MIYHFQMGQAVVHLMDISNLDEQIFVDKLPLSLLVEASNRFKSKKRINEWLATRLLLQIIEGDEAEIVYEDNGAPKLKDSHKHISISHSGTFVAIALSNERVGLDVQIITDKALRLSSRFLTQEEIALLNPSSDVERAIYLWCAKEAVYKYLSKPGTELKGGIVLNMLEGKTVETVHGLKLHFNKFNNLILTIAEM